MSTADAPLPTAPAVPGAPPSVLVVRAPYYRDIIDGMTWGATRILGEAGATQEILDVAGSFELAGQRKWAGYVRQFAHRVENDAYGSAWASIDGDHATPRKIMFEAHADEIGFIVKHITKEGFLRVDRIGGSDIATARGRRLDILGEKGSVRGVIGNTAIHLRRDNLSDEKAPATHDLYVDVGASSAEEVMGLGIRVGHPAVYTDAVEQLGSKHIIGRALDNRIGDGRRRRVCRAVSAASGAVRWSG